MTTGLIDDRITGPEFRRLALREARRYGADDWVFLRELIQNSRDAAATAVVISSGAEGGREWVRCRDDGVGMAWEEAQSHLMTLYASSKHSGAAGRFGVGFWSILRFEPERIVIRSRQVGAAVGWELRLTGDLWLAQTGVWDGPVGTEIELERQARSSNLGGVVRRAVRSEARHCRRLGSPDQVLDVSVDGEKVTEPLPNWSPGVRFSAAGVCGVVGFSERPVVELLSHGLRVRRFSTLDELDNGSVGSRPRIASGGAGLRVMLDCDGLDVLMSRRDVAEDPEVERAVTLAEQAVDQLIRRTARPTVRGRMWSAVRRGLRHRASAAGAGALLVAALAIAFGPWLRVDGPESLLAPELPMDAAGATVAGEAGSGIAERYRGPGMAPVPRRPDPPGISHTPIDEPLWLGAFRVTGIAADGRPVRSVPAARLVAADADAESVEIRLKGGGWEGRTRIPVPTGASVVVGSILADGAIVPLVASGDGDVWVDLPATGASLVEYEVAGVASVGASGPWPELSEALMAVAGDSRGAPLEEVIRRCSAAVARRIEYRQDRDAALLLIEARATETSVCRAAEAAGVGDCDVINTVLASMLAEAGYPVRLSVGWVTAGGAAQPGLHAWVEVDAGGGRWVAADATLGQPVVSPVRAATQLVPDRSRARRWTVLAAVGIVCGCGVLALGWWARWRRPGVRIEGLAPGGREELAVLVADRLTGDTSVPWGRWLDREAVIPLFGGGFLSPAALRRVAAMGMVVVAEKDGGDGVLRRVTALDGTDPVGRAAADAVDALDLDDWSARVAVAREDDLCRRVNRRLGAAGVGVRIGLVEGLDTDIEGVPLPTPGGIRWCLVDPTGTWWRGLLEGDSVAPGLAVLLAALRASETVAPASPEAFRVRQFGLGSLLGEENERE